MEKMNKNNPNFQQELDKIYALLMATLDWVERSITTPNYYAHRNWAESHRETYKKYYNQNKYQSLVKGFEMFSEPYKICFDTLYEAFIFKRTGININILDKFPDFEAKIYQIIKKGKIPSLSRYQDAQYMINFILLNGHSDDTLLPILRKMTNEYIKKSIKSEEKYKNFLHSGHILTVHAVV